MDALSEAIVRLLRRQDRTEQRLARIEQALGISATPAPPPQPEPVAEPSRSPEPLEAPLSAAPVPPPPVIPTATVSERPRKIETTVGLTWVSRIGAVTLVLAVAFIFKYAIDNQWIGEAGRVSLGIL